MRKSARMLLTPILFLRQSHHTSSQLFLCRHHNYSCSLCKLIVELVPHLDYWFSISAYFLLLAKYFVPIFLFLRVHLPLLVQKCLTVQNTENLRALTAWPIFTYNSYACLDSKSNQTSPTTLSSIYIRYYLNRCHSFRLSYVF